MEELENEMADVVVLGCNYANSLGVIKSIGEAGYKCGLLHHTSILNKKRITPDMASDYVVKGQYIDRKNDDEMIYALMATYKRAKEKLPVIASDDYSASFLDRFYDELSPYFRIAKWDGEVGRLTLFMEKEHQKDEALKAGFEAAAFWPIDVPKNGEAADIPKDVIFPCICKPEVSAGSGMSKEIMKVCQSFDELNDYFNELSKNDINGKILVEQFLSIDEEYTVPGLRIDGEVIIPSFIRKTVTGSGKVRGLTVMGLLEDTDTNAELRASIERLVTQMGICGMFDVEVIKSNGKFYFNEINLRSSAATYAVTGSGVNIPGILVDYLYGKDWRKNNLVIEPGKIFINEKPALQCFIQKDYSLKKYRQLIKDADIHLLTGDGDEGAKAAFLVYQRRGIIKRYVYKQWLLYQRMRSAVSKDSLSKAYGNTRTKAARYKNGILWKSASLKRSYIKKHHLRIDEEIDDSNIEYVRSVFENDIFDYKGIKAASESKTEYIFWSLDKIKAAGGYVYTARYKGKIAGMIDIRPISLDEWCLYGDAFIIANFCVGERFANMGIGTTLIERALFETAKKGCTLIADIHENNRFANDFYRRRGFKNVRLYKADDHFMIRLIHPNGQFMITSDTFKKMYTAVSMQCALTHYKDDGFALHDELLLDKWENDFAKYLNDTSDEEYQQMLYYYNERAITPLEYSIYKLHDKEEKKCLRFASSLYISSLCRDNKEDTVLGDRFKEYLILKEFYGRDISLIESADELQKFSDDHHGFYLRPVNRTSGKRTYFIKENTNKDLRKYFEDKRLGGTFIADEKVEADAVMKSYIRRRTAFVNAVTLNDKGNISIIFAICDFKFTGHDGEEEHTRDYFSYINDDGTIDKKIYSFVRGKEKVECEQSKVKRYKDEMPNWDAFNEMIFAAASKLPLEFLLGWECVYTQKGWIIKDVKRNPSFKEAQIAWDRGLIRRMELKMGRKLETNLWKVKAKPIPKETL